MRTMITEEYVDSAAALIDLPLHPEIRSAVVADLERIAAIADFLMAFPLEQSVESAPVFRP